MLLRSVCMLRIHGLQERIQLDVVTHYRNRRHGTRRVLAFMRQFQGVVRCSGAMSVPQLADSAELGHASACVE